MRFATFVHRAYNRLAGISRTPGIDTSHWEDVIRWNEVAATNNKFCIHKATELQWTDPKYWVNRQGCDTYGISRGAYNFFHPNSSPVEQAEYFLNEIQPPPKRIVCDVEVAASRMLGFTLPRKAMGSGKKKMYKVENAVSRLVLAGIAGSVKTWLDYCEEETGIKPLIYTSPGFWNTYIGHVSWASQYDLWVAHWTIAPNPTLPLGWSEWKIWQYSDKGVVNGIDSHVDVNWFNGNEDSCRAYFDTLEPLPPVHHEVWCGNFDEWARNNLGWSGSPPIMPTVN